MVFVFFKEHFLYSVDEYIFVYINSKKTTLNADERFLSIAVNITSIKQIVNDVSHQ